MNIDTFIEQLKLKGIELNDRQLDQFGKYYELLV